MILKLAVGIKVGVEFMLNIGMSSLVMDVKERLSNLFLIIFVGLVVFLKLLLLLV